MSFLDLPVSVQVVIYELIFVHPIKGWWYVGNNKLKLATNFIQVCRSIHDEATEVLYGKNNFSFESDNHYLKEWLLASGKEERVLD